VSEQQARGVHVKVYTHADKARLNIDYPIQRIHLWLDKAIQVPLEYKRLRSRRCRD